MLLPCSLLHPLLFRGALGARIWPFLLSVLRLRIRAWALLSRGAFGRLFLHCRRFLLPLSLLLLLRLRSVIWRLLLLSVLLLLVLLLALRLLSVLGLRL